MMCHKMGRPPICTIGLGLISVSSERRVPIPPARMTAFIRKSPSQTPEDYLLRGKRRLIGPLKHGPNHSWIGTRIVAADGITLQPIQDMKSHCVAFVEMDVHGIHRA